MIIDSFFENQSIHQITNEFEDLLKKVNISNLEIWQPVKDLKVDYNLTLSKKKKKKKNKKN